MARWVLLVAGQNTELDTIIIIMMVIIMMMMMMMMIFSLVDWAGTERRNSV